MHIDINFYFFTEFIPAGSKTNWSYNPTTNWLFASSHYVIWFREEPVCGKVEPRCYVIQQQTEQYVSNFEEQASRAQTCSLRHLPASTGVNNEAHW